MKRLVLLGIIAVFFLAACKDEPSQPPVKLSAVPDQAVTVDESKNLELSTAEDLEIVVENSDLLAVQQKGTRLTLTGLIPGETQVSLYAEDETVVTFSVTVGAQLSGLLNPAEDVDCGVNLSAVINDQPDTTADSTEDCAAPSD